MERVKGIEPSHMAWEANALPLSYTRLERTSEKWEPVFGQKMRGKTET